MKSLFRAITVILAFIGTVVVNALANLIPFNGVSTGQVSDNFPVYFVPAGYVFSIWGIIYVLIGIYSVFQAFKPQLEQKTFDRIGILFILSSIANSVWIVLWHYGYIKSTIIIMLLLLLPLIVIYSLIRKENITSIMARLPFSVYLGWISVATIANATVVLYYLGWKGFGISGPIWSSLLIIIAGILGLIFLLKQNDLAYGAVIIWALIGIAVKFSSNQAIFITATIVSAVLGLTSLYTLFRLYRGQSATDQAVL